MQRPYLKSNLLNVLYKRDSVVSFRAESISKYMANKLADKNLKL